MSDSRSGSENGSQAESAQSAAHSNAGSPEGSEAGSPQTSRSASARGTAGSDTKSGSGISSRRSSAKSTASAHSGGSKSRSSSAKSAASAQSEGSKSRASSAKSSVATEKSGASSRRSSAKSVAFSDDAKSDEPHSSATKSISGSQTESVKSSEPKSDESSTASVAESEAAASKSRASSARSSASVAESEAAASKSRASSARSSASGSRSGYSSAKSAVSGSASGSASGSRSGASSASKSKSAVTGTASSRTSRSQRSRSNSGSSSGSGSRSGSRSRSKTRSGSRVSSAAKSGSYSAVESGASARSETGSRPPSGKGSGKSSAKSSTEGSRKSSAGSKALGDYDEYYVVAEKTASEATESSAAPKKAAPKKAAPKKAAPQKPPPKEPEPEAPPKPKPVVRRPKPKPKPKAEKPKPEPEPAKEEEPPRMNIDIRRRPKWYRQMDDDQLKMFTALYEILDYEKAGNVTPDAVGNAITSLEIGLTEKDVAQVFDKIGRKPTETITFDEFLYAMAQTNKKLMGDEAEDVAPLTEAIQGYRTKTGKTPADIHRFYETSRKRAPHVLDLYTRGAKLYGLSNKAITKEMQRLRETLKGQRFDSPYAQVLPFVFLDFKEEVKHRKRQASPIKEQTSSAAEKSAHPSPPSALPPTGRHTPYELEARKQGKMYDRTGSPPKMRPRVPGWSLPKVQRRKVPLPVIPNIALPKNRELTVADNWWLRDYVGGIMDNYYSRLKNKHTKMAMKHWNNLHPELISSYHLRELFLQAYQTYSPFDEDDVQAFCPWVPMNVLIKPYVPHSHGVDDPYSHRFLSRVARNHSRYGHLFKKPDPTPPQLGPKRPVNKSRTKGRQIWGH